MEEREIEEIRSIQRLVEDIAIITKELAYKLADLAANLSVLVHIAKKSGAEGGT